MDYFLHLCILVSIYSILGISLNFIAGYTGILSLAHATFFGIGAYATSILLLYFHIPFLLALFLAFIITAFIAFLASFPILKLRDDALILVSLGFTFIIQNIMMNWMSLTRGPLGLKGIPVPTIFGFEFNDKISFLLLCVFFLIITYIFFQSIVKTPYGTILKGIRENEVVVSSFGYNPRHYKFQVFVIGSAFASISGSLFATYFSYIEPHTSFAAINSIHLAIMIILGGMGNLSASIVGMTVYIVAPELLRFVGLPSSIMPELRAIFFALILVVLMMFRPKGLFGEYSI